MTLSLSEESSKYIDFELKPNSKIAVPLMEYNGCTIINWKNGPGIAYHRTPFSKVLNKGSQLNIFRSIIEKVIDKALEKEVNKRYQNAGQMARHLKVILGKINEAAKRRS